MIMAVDRIPARRKRRRQCERREAERLVRRTAVAFTRWVVRAHRWTVDRAAATLGLREKTLSAWRDGWRRDRLRIELLGRKPGRGDAEERNLLLALFYLLGEGAGPRALADLFPRLSLAEVTEIHHRYQAIEKRRGCPLFVLTWKGLGRIWAMDFTHAPSPVDGQYPYLFMVRDLGTGEQLLALPTMDESGETARQALLALIREHGAPLVFKSDNGSAFIDDETRAMLAAMNVVQLFSPPATPEYNGSIEAGNGSVKTRAHHESARFDRAGYWTSDDVEAARLQANECPRKWLPYAPTPDSLWTFRGVIRPEERAVFLQVVEDRRRQSREERNFLPGVEPGPKDLAAIEREAISRALVACGYLEFRRNRRTRISPVINPGLERLVS